MLYTQHMKIDIHYPTLIPTQTRIMVEIENMQLVMDVQDLARALGLIALVRLRMLTEAALLGRKVGVAARHLVLDRGEYQLRKGNARKWT